MGYKNMLACEYWISVIKWEDATTKVHIKIFPHVKVATKFFSTQNVQIFHQIFLLRPFWNFSTQLVTNIIKLIILWFWFSSLLYYYDEYLNMLIVRASGHPRPTITWRREDGKPHKLSLVYSFRLLGPTFTFTGRQVWFFLGRAFSFKEDIHTEKGQH